MRKTHLLFISCCFYSSCLATTEIPNVTYNSKHHLPRFATHSDSALPSQIISKQQIKQTGAQDIEQVLIAAGLQVTDLTGDGTNLQINMRGFGENSGQNTLLLLNGQPLTNPDLGVYDINQIPVSIVKEIEIYPGSAGVLYGDQAVGGVIDIITKPIAKNHQYAQLGYGSFNAIVAQAGISRQLQHGLGLRFDLYHKNTDNYRDHNKLRTTHLDFAGSKKFASGSLFTEYQFNHQHLQYAGALTHSQVVANRRQAENATDFDQQDNQTLQVDYKQMLTDNWQFQLANLFTLMGGNGVLTNKYNKNRYQVNITPQFQGLMTIAGVDVLPTIGVEFNKGRYKFDSADYDSTATQTLYSSFAQVKIPLFTSWDLSTGLRYAQAESSQDSLISGFGQDTTATNRAFITNVGLNWHINSVLKAFLRRAGSFRFPKTDENINTNTGKPLKTQTGVSYETGLIWQQARWNGMLTIYQLNLKNEIIAIPIPNSRTTFAENQNLPPTSRTGFSVNTSYQLLKPLSFNAVYRYVNARFSSGPDKGNRIPFVADNNFSLNTIYHFLPHWSASFTAIYTGKMTFASDPEERTRLLGGYTTYNLNLRYHYHLLTANLHIENLTNKDYYAYAFDEYNGPETSSYFYPAPGRDVMLTFTLKI